MRGSKVSIATSYSTQNKWKKRRLGKSCWEVLSLKKMKLCTESYTEVASSHTVLKRVHKKLVKAICRGEKH